MSKLKHQSCEWAINHVDIYGDTDLFPRLFEIDAIKLYREDCIKLLSKVDVGAYEWNAGRKTIVPKDAFSFRSAIQLDPLDTLFFSALIYEIGSLIETKRLGKDVVFSHRFQPLRDGTMYAANPNWTIF